MAKEVLSAIGGLRVAHVKVGQFRVKLPKSKVARRALGGGLVAGSALAILPVFGLWMLPAGLLVLSVDSPRVRRFRRVQEIKVVRWWRARQAASKSPSGQRKRARRTGPEVG